MKKTTFLILFLFSLSFVIAVDEQNGDMTKITDLNEGYLGIAAEPRSLFAFIPAQQCPIETAYRANIHSGFNPSGRRTEKYGAQCNVDDRIELLACDGSSSSPGFCRRLFNDDYEKTSETDLLNLNTACAGGNCLDQQYMQQFGDWYNRAIDGKYVGYNCRVCETQGQQNLDGEWQSIIVPPKAETNDKVTIEGTFQAFTSGTYYLEAGILPKRFSILATHSQCDDNPHFAGKYVTLNAGESERIIFKVLTYEVAGNYDAILGSYSDCLPPLGNGEKLNTITQVINIEEPSSSGTQIPKPVLVGGVGMGTIIFVVIALAIFGLIIYVMTKK